MISFLHNFKPDPLLISLGPISIYWYGFFMMLAILFALVFIIHLAKRYKINSSTIIDLAIWVIIAGIIGARLYELIIDFNYYTAYPLDILKVWQGGLSIHGAIIFGLIALYLFSRKLYKNNKFKVNYGFWKLSAIIVPGLALGQAIGRWGNYFNQELFGRPSNTAWAIPIDIANRPIEYISYQYFEPTFLYESLGSLFIFIILFLFHFYILKKGKINKFNFIRITSLYIFLYSILRFSLEFIRLDATLLLGGWRWPQIISIILIIISIYLFIQTIPHAQKKTS